MSTDTVPSPAAWRLQMITLRGFPFFGAEQRNAIYKVQHLYDTAPNEELAAAYAGDYLETLLPLTMVVETTKPGRFWTEFEARPRRVTGQCGRGTCGT